MNWWRRRTTEREAGRATLGDSPIRTNGKPLREFAYLDEVSVQSLLASLVGELPSEVTSLSAKTTEAEITSAAGVNAPLLAKAELSARFSGGSSDSSQVLSRAVAESLFRNLHDLTQDRLVWSAGSALSQPIDLQRGSLIEIEVELSPDPIYGFAATMGVLTGLAEDYPALLKNSATALIVAEAGPVTKALERMLVGLIPLKSKASSLRAGVVNGSWTAGTSAFFEEQGVHSEPLHVVGVTEQANYWRDVRRVLFSKSSFTIFGRVSRTDIQASWVPVKLTEVMREIAPQFPDAITRVGRTNYSAPVNPSEEANNSAMQKALVEYAFAAGGDLATQRHIEIESLASTLKQNGATLHEQRQAFAQIGAWLIENGVIDALPANDRALRAAARSTSGLKTSSAPTSLSDFAYASQPEQPDPEALIDLEIVAIYW